ncbi:MAG: glycosyltransferase family 4 protein [Rhodobacterales bacterium]|nr:glycosyltransferase family 4 protein [Rhodobacterales bacterium]NCT11684.1 glycosyltransferase family 4 protein [Rhodobacterales bacterium]
MNSTATPALYFHPDQIEGEGRDLVGRRSAGQSFLAGFLRHMPGDSVQCLVETQAGGQAFDKIARSLGETRPITTHVLRGGGDFTSAGCVFFPTPGYSNAPWRRQQLGPDRCSLVGITHTMSTARIIMGLHHLMSEPVEPWDAIICTSRAVRAVVERQFEAETAYFRQRFGATRMPLPQLPVIPLGIAAEDFTPLPGARAGARASVGTPQDAVVIMTMGRLSVVEKANPVPLFLAMEHLARTCGKPLHLWLVGWASRPEEEALHRQGAATLCPSVTLRMIDGRDPDVRRNVWAGADIFTLPADSIQETFGLVPVEAMAAGLPVVMPDWDGFRDTVLHGETGFLVPTRMAAPGGGVEMARRFADQTDGYLQYLTMVQALVAIDVPAYAAALGRLIDDPDLRARMGAAGARHVRDRLDWRAVIPRYADLAATLAEARRGTVASTPPLAQGAPNPTAIDPFDLYADYPTATLSPDTPLRLREPATAQSMVQRDIVSGRQLYRRMPMPQEVVQRFAAAIAVAGAPTLAELAAAMRAPLHVAEAAVLILAKSGYVELPQIDPRGVRVLTSGRH